MSDLTDKAEYLLNHYQEGFPVFPPGSYKYGLMRDLIEALHRLAALEELTARQIKRTGELTGTVDKNLKRIRELEMALSNIRSSYTTFQKPYPLHELIEIINQALPEPPE